MNNKTSPCQVVSKGDCWTVTWQDPRCCRGVDMPASCRTTAAPCKGTLWCLAPHSAKLGASQISPPVIAPFHPGQIILGGQERTGTCPGLASVAASQPWPLGAHHGTQKHPSEEQGCPSPLRTGARKWTSSRFAQDDGAGRRELGSWLHKCLPCTLVAQIQTKRLLSSHVSNPFSIYGQFPFHTSQSHISPDFCWDFASPCSQDLPGAAHGSNLLGSSTLCPLPGELLATLPTCMTLPFISSLPIFFLPSSGNCTLCIFFPYSDQSSPSSRILLLFFPHMFNSIILCQLSVALCL